MGNAKFIINTTMTKKDYRKFLYIATFRRNKAIIPMLGLIALLGSIVINSRRYSITLIEFLIIAWIFLFALAIGVVIFKVERKNAQRVKTDKTGTFDSINTLKFFDDKLVFENEELKSTGELRYDQFYALLESKDYFIFYLTMNQASLVRKRDLDDPDAFKEFILEKFTGKYKTI